ncbi:DUF6083 domain-containing protein [Streptomyces sp. NPDC052396]|uniref:DUF6083 domain-containing protein n=1 Tax=Streptomyces sp. NPDC052396 TaxID=3365689 RepID=UPI0037CDC7A8
MADMGGNCGRCAAGSETGNDTVRHRAWPWQGLLCPDCWTDWERLNTAPCPECGAGKPRYRTADGQLILLEGHSPLPAAQVPADERWCVGPDGRAARHRGEAECCVEHRIVCRLRARPDDRYPALVTLWRANSIPSPPR